MKPAFGWLSKFRASGAEAKPGAKLVNLGCGGHFHPDWMNLDFVARPPNVLQHDLRARLPFDDVSFEVVYHSHVLEHFPRSFAPQFLQECRRVLIPGGILRVVVPDLETIARLYLKNLEGALAGDPQATARCEWMTLELLDQMVREESGGDMLKYWRQNPMPAEEFVIERVGQEVRLCLCSLRKVGASPRAATPPKRDPATVARFRESGEVHKWMYDRWSLGRLLRDCGFIEIKVCAAGESQIPNFSTYRLDLNVDGSVRKPDSLFMEARKPAR
jgi:SAM-dependent methyltransferase